MQKILYITIYISYLCDGRASPAAAITQKPSKKGVCSRPRLSCFDAKNSDIVSRNNAARVARVHLDRSSPSSPASPKIISNTPSASYFTSRFDVSSGSRVPLAEHPSLSLALSPPFPLFVLHVISVNFLSRPFARLSNVSETAVPFTAASSRFVTLLYERTWV